MKNKELHVIAVEEHYMSENVNEAYKKIMNEAGMNPAQVAKASFIDRFVKQGLITDVGDIRLAKMDETGVDIQLISYGNNSPMYLEAEHAVALCKMANDDLATYCLNAPNRFYGFAALPIADVQAAVTELERCVNELNFKGVVFNGGMDGLFLDDERFFPIFEKAAQLGVPVQLHPGEVDEAISSHYYQGSWSLSITNVFAGHGIGWHYDSGVQYLRMILSGIFDKLPELTMICGHWGEMLPYYFNRLDTTLTPEVTGLKHCISYYFKNNMYISPSGMLFEDDFEFCLSKVGADRLLWATDYPYRTNINSQSYLETFDLSHEERHMIAHKNAEKLFGLSRS